MEAPGVIQEGRKKYTEKIAGWGDGFLSYQTSGSCTHLANNQVSKLPVAALKLNSFINTNARYLSMAGLKMNFLTWM